MEPLTWQGDDTQNCLCALPKEKYFKSYELWHIIDEMIRLAERDIQKDQKENLIYDQITRHTYKITWNFKERSLPNWQ